MSDLYIEVYGHIKHLGVKSEMQTGPRTGTVILEMVLGQNCHRLLINILVVIIC